MSEETPEIVAYSMEVRNQYSSGWSTHYLGASDVPDNPEDAWRDDHDVRNVTALVRLEDVEGRLLPGIGEYDDA